MNLWSITVNVSYLWGCFKWRQQHLKTGLDQLYLQEDFRIWRKFHAQASGTNGQSHLTGIPEKLPRIFRV
jgi:hypothetical protein